MSEQKPSEDVTVAFERALSGSPDPSYVLRLYVVGYTRRSVAAVANIKRICEEHLKGRYRLDVIDLREHPTLAKGEQIIAAPTLLKQLPLPLRRIIGDMSDTERVLVGLDLRERTGP